MPRLSTPEQGHWPASVVVAIAGRYGTCSGWWRCFWPTLTGHSLIGNAHRDPGLDVQRRAPNYDYVVDQEPGLSRLYYKLASGWYRCREPEPTSPPLINTAFPSIVYSLAYGIVGPRPAQPPVNPGGAQPAATQPVDLRKSRGHPQ